jgi:peptidoglycan hydrolase-like protein with peptidoglycan-binding domain
MDISLSPTVPASITVHLGSPSSNAENVTVSFSDYIKNVASSEVYPTWEQAALEANILAIISFALNRVYTKYYPSRGYSFDITSSTAIDQKFINGRSTFENIDRLVDDIFTHYIRRSGHVEPLAAKFCNGTTVTCEGLRQWGSQSLAQQGYSALEILRAYYGDDIELVTDAQVTGVTRTYPGSPLRQGDVGVDVAIVQGSLNRIAQSYPAIPKIDPITGIFDQSTEDAVLAFQRIFNLTADGIVGMATWYKMVQLYVAVTRLAELVSEGQQFVGISWEYPALLSPGDSGEKVRLLQYMLSVLSNFIDTVPDVQVDGDYGPATTAAVAAFQEYAGLDADGIVGPATWGRMYQSFAGIEDAILDAEVLFPKVTSIPVSTLPTVRTIQQQLRQAAAVIPAMAAPRVTGTADRQTAQAVAAFQRAMGLRPTGRTDEQVRAALAAVSTQAAYASTTRFTQYPGWALHLGSHDTGGTAPFTTEVALLGQPVRGLQRMLRTLALPSGPDTALIPDGIYGQNTLAAVLRFQQGAGLPATGITDLRTWTAIAEQYRPVARVARNDCPADLALLAQQWGGCDGNALAWLQATAGLPVGEPFGVREQAAVDALHCCESMILSDCLPDDGLPRLNSSDQA